MRIQKLIPGGVRRHLKSVLFLCQRWKWNYSKSSQLGISNQAHFLVVKEVKYIPAVRVAIESFLYWNSRSTVVVHCDELTLKGLSKTLRRLIDRDKVEIVCSVPKNKPWQLSKIDLVITLFGTDRIYMDSDLRWNGPCPKLNGPLFYVHEFELSKHVDFIKMNRDVVAKVWPSAQMHNTSFAYFHNFSLDEDKIQQVYKLYQDINDWCSNDLLDEEMRSHIARLSEQLALSIVINSAIKMGSLKTSDSRADGQFVESSYLGATGLGF